MSQYSSLKNKLIKGDSIDELKKLKDNSVDLLCTDPPYGYGFMGKSWDKTLPPKKIFQESLRVLKPGSFAFVMSAPRSDVQYRMAQMLEDVGFEIGYTPIYWTYATGFPKASNIGKMVDKRLGAKRETTGTRVSAYGDAELSESHDGRNLWGKNATNVVELKNKPASDEAKKLDGSYGGYQPKPAVEVVIVAMKPLSQKGYLDQALDNQKGITWLDDCRIPVGASPLGRFAANLLVSDDTLEEDFSRYYSLDAWWNSRMDKLPDEVRNTFPFLIVPKASKSEKNNGVENNIHPTVKPLNLMSYLVTLGSRKDDVVLDPFMGSGTTPMACVTLSRNYIGIEREDEYFEIANARVNKLENPLKQWEQWI